RSMGENAHRLILSGPAAGVLGGGVIAAAANLDDVVTLDMGGTSADIGVIRNGLPRTRIGLHRGAPVPIQIPTLELATIGAGGGRAMGWVEGGGALRVGPMSAGADPGPVCYGKGGLEPTVTDAHLVLGRLDPANFLGGELPLDREAARAAVGRLASLLGST